jgi:ribulose-5-phosphate 4-epimerase/fuculose-1-phosphate aldolase
MRGVVMSNHLDGDRARYIDLQNVVVNVAWLLYRRGFTELCGGNVSVRQGDLVVMTPTKASEEYGWRIPAEDTIVMSTTGEVLHGERANLSRESSLHLDIYRAFSTTGSVFHLHTVEAIGIGGISNDTDGSLLQELGYGTRFHIMDGRLTAQTEDHDREVLQLLSNSELSAGVVIAVPGHGIFSAAPTSEENIMAVERFRTRMEVTRLRGRLRSAAGVSR